MTTTITIKDKAVNTTYQNVTGLTGSTGDGATFDVTVSGSNTASSLAAYSGCVSGQISCAMIASGATGSISFNSTLGTTYYIQVQRRSGTTNGDQTGNIAMAAPALSKFTMNLAADPQVKNIMED